MANIMIVDDEVVLVNSLKFALEDDEHKVVTFYNGDSAMHYLINHEPDLILLDLRLPDMHGLDILRQIKGMNSNLPTIVITAHGDITSAINAMKLGAFDFILKPFELEEITMLVDKSQTEAKLYNEVELLRSKRFQQETIVGESKEIFEVKEKIKKVASIDECTVLIRGESGTGKELVAKAIHNESPKRKKMSFIDIDCSALPEQLLESELFGYEKGAFTDAKHKKVGLLELADKGTLFLDEIGDMPLNLQTKILKFLESRSFRRIGGEKEIAVDVRVIAATNTNLEKSIKEKIFREDLYYRLNVVPISVPPLRQRGADIGILSEHFLNYFIKKFAKSNINFSKQAEKALLEYHWPGNVRELKNLIERLVILSSGSLIELKDLPDEIKMAGNIKSSNTKILSDHGKSLDDMLLNVEYELIRDALIKAKGVKSVAADMLGISRHSLKRRLQKFDEKTE
ncbi:sigma-54 dependent transcriptional regulator [Flexistipes sinusarabici]|nr:sigma-54 dependent transcriptional regulator [Flexistipes sinusarabici]